MDCDAKVSEDKLLVDNYLENNQHTDILNIPMVAIDIPGDRNSNITRLVEKVGSIPRVLISKVRSWLPQQQPVQQVLPLTNTDLQSSTQNHRPPKLGKLGLLVFPVAFTVISGLIFSGMILKQVHQLIIVGLLVSSAAVYNGHVFGVINRTLGHVLQFLGVNLIMCLLCVLLGTILNSGFSYACWVCALFYLLSPLYYLYYRRLEDIGV